MRSAKTVKRAISIAVMMAALAGGVLLSAQSSRALEAQLKAAQHKADVEGDFKGAIGDFKTIVSAAGGNRSIAAQALLEMADSYRKLGSTEARPTYERLVRDYGDLPAAATARTRLGRQASTTATLGDRAVWTGSKVDGTGRVSPDGRYVTYTDRDGFNNVAIHDLVTRTDRFLTTNTGWPDQKLVYEGTAEHSAFSPDGKQVAYTWLQGTDFGQAYVPQVRILTVGPQPDPKPRVLLTFSRDNFRFFNGIDWSPDGKRVAIVSANVDGSTQIVIGDVADGSKRVLKTTGWRGPRRIFFSRDSRYLAFNLPAGDDEEHDVFLLDVEGGSETRVVAGPSDDTVVGWSPDGTHFLFSSNRARSRDLWAVRVANGKSQGQALRIRKDIGMVGSLGVTTSGTVYLTKNTSTLDVKLAPVDLASGKMVGEVRHFSEGFRANPGYPEWSPDGRFLSYRVEGGALAIRSVDTGKVELVPHRLEYVFESLISPDGRSLGVRGRDDKGRSGIFQVDRRTGEAKPIALTTAVSPDWSPDGKKIYYLAREGGVGVPTIREHDLTTGADRELVKVPNPSPFFDLSPDGRSLVIWNNGLPTAQTLSVLLVPIGGGPPREIFSMPASDRIGNQHHTLAWTPDGRGVLLTKKVNGVVKFVLLDVDNGRTRTLDINVLAGAQTGGFSLSPDGRSIAFVAGEEGGNEVWAYENLLPAARPQAAR